jgi:GrpB-like predicted nucleotidyltransferase (UPF0157 family)
LESLEQKIKRVTAEDFSLTGYDPAWPIMFEREKEFLLAEFPSDFILGIEHIGSTAVPGLKAKPIVDMLIIISDAQRGRELIPAHLEPLGYDCFWRPTLGDDVPPWYTWCIRRDQAGLRTHHLHFAEPGIKDAELRFRDILRGDSALAADYARLKTRLWHEHPGDRVAYTMAKGEFIRKALNNQE